MMSKKEITSDLLLQHATDKSGEVDRLNAETEKLWRHDTLRALAVAEEAYDLAKRQDDLSGLAYSLRNIGICHWRLANYDKALKALKEALILFKKLEDYEGCISAWHNLSMVQRQIGDYPQALESAFNSLKLSQQIHSQSSEATALAAIGAVYFLLEDFSRALQYYQESLELWQRLHDKLGEGQLYSSIGRIYGRIGENEKALECFTKSLQIARELNDEMSEAFALQNTGEVYGQMGKFQQALEMLNQSLAIKEKLHDRASVAETLITVGKLHAKQQQYEQAIPVLYRALSLAETANCKSQLLSAHQTLAIVHKHKSDFKTALQHYENFHRMERSILNEENHRRLISLQVQYELEKKQREAEEYRRKTMELAEINTMLRKQAEQLFLQATTDGLTGVYNRRFFDETLQREFERVRRYGSVMTLAIADVDFFKQVNDTYSHQVGDEVLKIVAHILRQSSRISDIVARYGGEEFALILPETPLHCARVACEKIRTAITSHYWESLAEGLRVTISFGLADSCAKKSAAHLLASADTKLYEAKAAGRNCVAC
jgi:diguanylate cyclase (GGDEF)-like protein